MAGSVARIGERRGLVNISVELARIIEEMVVGASGRLFGELDVDEWDRWLE